MRTPSYKRIEDIELNEAIPLEVIHTDSSEHRPESNDADDEYTVNYDHDENDSDSSATSEIFAEINDYTKSGPGEETFEDDAGFQTQWNKFKTGPATSKLLLVISALFFVLIWAGFLVVYSNGNARRQAASLWHGSETNVVELSHRNISLNSFDPNNKNITFANIRKGFYTPSFSPIRWLSSPQFPKNHEDTTKGYYVTRKRDRLVVLLADSNYEHTVLDSKQFSYGNRFYYAQDVILNPGSPVDDIDAVHLLRSDLVLQWRHSSFSLFWLWKSVSGEVFPVQPQQTKTGKLSKLHFAKFDPTGKNLVFGFEHDIYLMDVHTHKVLPISNTGNSDVFNGKPDWVYEEEIYPQDHMVWWSPDLKNLVYAQINDTEVGAYGLDYYVKGLGEVAMSYNDLDSRAEKGGEIVNQYPKHTSIKYPKPGTANPTVKLFSYNLELNSTTEITGLSDDVVENDFILYDVAWVDAENMLIKVSDRYSSVLQKKLFKPTKNGDVELVSIEKAAEYGGWIEKPAAITLVKRKDFVQYLDRVVVDDLVQLALFDLASAKNYTRLLGPVNYNSVISYDAVENCVYGKFGTNLNASLSMVSLSDGKKTVLAEDGEYDLNFSPNGQFLQLLYEGPNQPWQKIVNMAFVAEHADYISELETVGDDTRLSTVLSNTNLPTKVLSTVSVGRHGDKVNMMEIFPPNFKRGSKHPLLVHVYGGPGSITVTKSFGIDFQDVVSSQLNAVVLIIDPRGTGTDDWKLKAHLKGNMGLLEPQDILAITRDYIASNKYIDEQKTAVWGWSYGGFTTLKTLETDKGSVFKYGMAVAPVTNWLFYDSVFTERIMGSPAENPNYEGVSRINDFSGFTGVTRFLVMQGTADDNVHMQNTLWLMDHFDTAGVENYDVHFFPDSDHSIYYHNANTIVYDKLLWWLQKAFSGYFV